MKISIITVCFKSAATLRTAMDSVLSQSGADYEYIVIDGVSKDGTVELLQEYERRFAGRMVWRSEPDNGMYDALNKGIALATGDVVGIINADDFLQSDDVLAKVAREFESEDGLECVYADIRFVRGAGATLQELRQLPTGRYYSAKSWKPWMMRWGKMPPHPAVYIKRDCFERFGGYRVDYKLAADYELVLRFLMRENIRARYLDACLVGMRMGGMSTKGLRSTLTLQCENVRANRDNGFFCCLPMMLPKYFFRAWEFIGPRIGLGGGKDA